MIAVAHGATRTVILIGRIVIKFPTLRHDAQCFALGLLANVNEHLAWRKTRHANLAEVFGRGPFGLWLVMRRYEVIVDRALTAEEIQGLPFCCIDNNGANVAFGENGEFVLIDYGNPSWYLIVDDGTAWYPRG